MNLNEEKIITDFECNLEKIRYAIIVAQENYNIWWIYKNDRLKYADVMNDYIGFFSNSIHAHFTAMLLSLTKFLDKKAKSNISIFALLYFAKANDLISDEIINDCLNELNTNRELIKKTMLLRNNYFAHLSSKLSYELMLRKAEITYNNFKELIELSGELFNKISYSYNRSSFASFDIGAKNDTYSLLSSLIDYKKNN